MQIQNLAVGYLATNCYLITDEETRQTYIIDPGEESNKIITKIISQKLLPISIINTHGHADHIGANLFIKEKYPDIKIHIHKLDAPALVNPNVNLSSMESGLEIKSPKADVLLEDDMVIHLNKVQLTVIHTPGHTPGCICLYVKEQYLFSGDTLFCGDIGRCDLPGGDEKQMMNSLKKLKRIVPPTTTIFPGHGQQCVMKNELIHNEYLR